MSFRREWLLCSILLVASYLTADANTKTHLEASGAKRLPLGLGIHKYLEDWSYYYQQGADGGGTGVVWMVASTRWFDEWSKPTQVLASTPEETILGGSVFFLYGGSGHPIVKDNWGVALASVQKSTGDALIRGYSLGPGQFSKIGVSETQPDGLLLKNPEGGPGFIAAVQDKDDGSTYRHYMIRQLGPLSCVMDIREVLHIEDKQKIKFGDTVCKVTKAINALECRTAQVNVVKSGAILMVSARNKTTDLFRPVVRKVKIDLSAPEQCLGSHTELYDLDLGPGDVDFVAGRQYSQLTMIGWMGQSYSSAKQDITDLHPTLFTIPRTLLDLDASVNQRSYSDALLVRNSCCKSPLSSEKRITVNLDSRADLNGCAYKAEFVRDICSSAQGADYMFKMFFKAGDLKGKSFSVNFSNDAGSVLVVELNPGLDEKQYIGIKLDNKMIASRAASNEDMVRYLADSLVIILHDGIIEVNSYLGDLPLTAPYSMARGRFTSICVSGRASPTADRTQPLVLLNFWAQKLLPDDVSTSDCYKWNPSTTTSTTPQTTTNEALAMPISTSILLATGLISLFVSSSGFM